MPTPAPATPTPAWVKTVLQETIPPDLASLETLSPLATLPEDAPAWARRALQEVETGLFPALKNHDLATVSPALLGGILGQQCALCYWLGEHANHQEPFWQTCLPILAPAIEHFDQGAKHALALALDQPHHEAAPFFQAFATSLARKPAGQGLDYGTTAFPVYLALLFLCPMMHQCQSVAQLHQKLRQLLGPDLTGKPKRLEKICQRIGLRLRSPGRPAKTTRLKPPPTVKPSAKLGATVVQNTING